MQLNLGNSEQSIDDQINSLTERFNRQESNMDSFNQKLTPIASGKLQAAWDGSTVNAPNLSTQHGLRYSPIFLVYYNLSTEPGVWFLCDDLRVDGTGQVTQEFRAYTNTLNVVAYLSALVAGTPCTVTFAWFLFREPAQTVA